MQTKYVTSIIYARVSDMGDIPNSRPPAMAGGPLFELQRVKLEDGLTFLPKRHAQNATQGKKKRMGRFGKSKRTPKVTLQIGGWRRRRVKCTKSKEINVKHVSDA